MDLHSIDSSIQLYMSKHLCGLGFHCQAHIFASTLQVADEKLHLGLSLLASKIENSNSVFLGRRGEFESVLMDEFV